MASSLPAREEVPEPLLEYSQWLCWRAEERDGKPTKIPIDPGTGEFASTTDPETWATFESAREQVQFETEDGLGFVFTDDDPIVGVDLQERAGEAVLLAVAFDVRVVGPDGETHLTVVVAFGDGGPGRTTDALDRQ